MLFVDKNLVEKFVNSLGVWDRRIGDARPRRRVTRWPGGMYRWLWARWQ